MIDVSSPKQASELLRKHGVRASKRLGQNFLCDQKARLNRIVLLVQQEVAERMTAAPGSDACGAMSLYVQYHAHAELVGTVPRSVFLPAPEVSSAIVALDPVVPGTVPVEDET